MKIDSKHYTPLRGTKGSAGIDLKAVYMDIDWFGGIVKYYTGVRVDTEKNRVGLLFPRSSIYKKKDLLCLANSVGVIDSDYRGEIVAIFRLRRTVSSFIRWLLKKLDIYQINDRVAQIVVVPYDSSVEYTDNLSATTRGDKGFGSTGK